MKDVSFNKIEGKDGSLIALECGVNYPFNIERRFIAPQQIKTTIKNHITKVFEQVAIYGEKKVHKQLLEDGIKVSLNTVARYRQVLGLQAY
jgi:DNA-directed RNA polymerase specialized sigma54-like protein